MPVVNSSLVKSKSSQIMDTHTHTNTYTASLEFVIETNLVLNS